MGYDINVVKPENERRNNRELAATKYWMRFRRIGTEFPVDHVALVHSLAGECGITKEEWLRQNLGIELNSETPTCWTQITFWEKVRSSSLFRTFRRAAVRRQ